MEKEEVFKQEIKKSLIIASFLLGLFGFLFYLERAFSLLRMLPKF